MFNIRISFAWPAACFYLVCVLYGALAFLPLSDLRGGESVDFSRFAGQGVFRINDFSAVPEGNDGILKSLTLKLPDYTGGVYFAGGQTRWPANANRILPRPFSHDGSVSRLPYGGLFLILRLTDGEYLAVLPIAEKKSMSWLHPDDNGDILLSLGTLGKEKVKGDFSLFAWSRSEDIYRACYDVWKLAVAAAGTTVLRSEKSYPQIFRYLGWCTWEQYHKDINGKIILDAWDILEKSKVPVRWILIDDGHEEISDNRLVSFAPDRKKFPEGWTKILARRRQDAVKWVGLWHCNQGYWGTIAAENKLGSLNESLSEFPNKAYLPKTDRVSMRKFFDAYMKSAADYGFDFVKIDVQAANLRMYRGVGNAVEAAVYSAQAREDAVEKYLGRNMINCMAHNSVCVFNTLKTSVTRCSIDYHKGNVKSARSHIWQSFANTLWMGQTVWPDHDMFHSCDPACGRLMAVSKAMSGAPVYISDAPDKLVEEYIRPLCFSDGLLLRPEAPGMPLPDSVLLNPLEEKGCYRVIAPLPNGAAAIVLYNLYNEKGTVIPGTLKLEDYQWRNGMVQPYKGRDKLPEQGVLLYDWYGRKGRVLDNEYKVDLNGFSDRLLLLTPIKAGWSVIGRTDKYLSPAAVKDVAAADSKLIFTLKESGPVAVYSAGGVPKMAGCKAESLGNGIYLFKLPVGEKNLKVTVIR